MKKILLIILLLFIGTSAFANTEDKKSTLAFVYINGSNNNDEKMKNWYLKGINKLHPVMKKKFNSNSYFKKWKKADNIIIDDNPQVFFWGYDSKTDLDFVKERINISRAYSSLIAYEARSMLAQFLHDAIWVQKEHNMLPILDELNMQIKEIANTGRSIILYGYSAGTFVNYQYLVYKLPYVNIKNLFKALNVNDDLMNFIEENPRKNTCLSALMHDKGNIGVVTNTGHFILNQNTEKLKENYLNIDTATEAYCAPKDKVIGVVNFGSPLPLFYSDIADENYDPNYFTAYMLKYVLENGMYFLTVNFREDPLGFPTNKNLTIEQYEKVLELDIENPTGVIYDNSKVWSRRSSFVAHTSYWGARSIFAKSVIKSFVEGTRYLYDEEYRKKVLKNKS